MSGTPAGLPWRRLSELGEPNEATVYLIQHPSWRHPTVARWDGSRWLMLSPGTERGYPVTAKTPPLMNPTWFVEINPLVAFIQAELETARARSRELLAEIQDSRQ